MAQPLSIHVITIEFKMLLNILVVLYDVGCNCFLLRFSSGHVRRKGDGICQKVSAGFKVDAKRLPVLDSISGYIPESIFLHASYT
jgi:hypothetical protein